MNIREIQSILPHRYPFLLVDKIVEQDENRIVGIKNVTINEPFFQGHFPGFPVMPGVLILEAMAQAAGVLFLGKHMPDRQERDLGVERGVRTPDLCLPEFPHKALHTQLEKAFIDLRLEARCRGTIEFAEESLNIPYVIFDFVRMHVIQGIEMVDGGLGTRQEVEFVTGALLRKMRAEIPKEVLCDSMRLVFPIFRELLSHARQPVEAVGKRPSVTIPSGFIPLKKAGWTSSISLKEIGFSSAWVFKDGCGLFSRYSWLSQRAVITPATTFNSLTKHDIVIDLGNTRPV